MKVFLSIANKRKIVGEAYAQPFKLRATAWRYDVQPAQICRWRAHIPAINEDREAAPRNKTLHRGKASIQEEQWDHIFTYLQQYHEEGHIVSVCMLAIELCHEDAAYADVSSHVLEQWIHRFLQGRHIAPHHVTQIAQNTRYNQQVMADWVGIVSENIHASEYSPGYIVNIDETNIYFDMTGSSTLEIQGQHTISIQNTGSSQHCTVLLGVTMDGQKLPPLIIFKGTYLIVGSCESLVLQQMDIQRGRSTQFKTRLGSILRFSYYGLILFGLPFAQWLVMELTSCWMNSLFI